MSHHKPLTQYERDKEVRRRSLQEMARDACKNLGGIASIDERYSIVDTKIYKIVER